MLFFCRFTQLGLLRLLTTAQVMGPDVLTQGKAWQVYRRWLADNRVEFHTEPQSEEFESLFERLSSRSRPSPKVWADAYLGAFASAAGLTLITFDRALSKLPGITATVLLGSN
jgi:hypothetical protein